MTPLEFVLAMVILAVITLIALVVRAWDDEKQELGKLGLDAAIKIFVVSFVAAFMVWYLLLGMGDLTVPANFIAALTAAIAGMPFVKSVLNAPKAVRE